MVEMLLQNAVQWNLHSQQDALVFLGKRFRPVMRQPNRLGDVSIAEELIKRHLFVHVDSMAMKADALLAMSRKLYALVQVSRRRVLLLVPYFLPSHPR